MNQAKIEKVLEEYRQIGMASMRATQSEWAKPKPKPEPPFDLYAERFLALIDHMRANPTPTGCLPWLAENHAALHRLLTVVLQDKLQGLWDKRAPIGAFQFILDRIWDAHRTARELYATHQKAQTAADAALKTSGSVFRKALGDGDGQ